MTDPAEPLKVLSVVGAGRSGTTILASILGEIEGFASAGELRWLWQRGVVEQRPCGCGKIPLLCPVWSGVINQAVAAAAGPKAGPTADTVSGIISDQHELTRQINVPRVLRSANGGREDWEPLRRVRNVTAAACAAFAEATGATVIVDTSKRALDAAIMASLPSVQPYVLHVVRDPRAVVHSWGRTKTFSVAGETRTMGSRGLLSTVRRWTSNCLATEVLRRQIPPSRWLFLRYEDFARSPRTSVERILALLDETGTTPFTSETAVQLHPNHIVVGNPSRFTTGSVEIRADEAWRDAMAGRDQNLVVASTFPLMLRYGYLRARGGAPAHAAGGGA